jgi:hypothetical protein
LKLLQTLWHWKTRFEDICKNLIFYINVLGGAMEKGKSKQFFILVFFCMSTCIWLLTGCSSDQEVKSDPVCLGITQASADYMTSQTFYWKEGTFASLDADDSTTTDIAIDGTDIYIAGDIADAADNSISHACIWKNGKEKSLDTSTDDSGANAILLNGGHVHAVGYKKEGRNDKACYWYDGTPDILQKDYSYASYASNIAIKNSSYMWEVASMYTMMRTVGFMRPAIGKIMA